MDWIYSYNCVVTGVFYNYSLIGYGILLGIMLSGIPLTENITESKYGAYYREYKKVTPVLLPLYGINRAAFYLYDEDGNEVFDDHEE